MIFVIVNTRLANRIHFKKQQNLKTLLKKCGLGLYFETMDSASVNGNKSLSLINKLPGLHYKNIKYVSHLYYWQTATAPFPNSAFHVTNIKPKDFLYTTSPDQLWSICNLLSKWN
jgi:hypothetical protein